MVIGDKADIAEKCMNSLSTADWELFNQTGDQMTFRNNAFLIRAQLSEVDDDAKEVLISLELEIMSIDLAAPPNATNVVYFDSSTELRFNTTIASQELVQFFAKSLSADGWKSTTPAPIAKESFAAEPELWEELIFLNDSKDEIKLEIRKQRDAKQVRAIFRTSGESK